MFFTPELFSFCQRLHVFSTYTCRSLANPRSVLFSPCPPLIFLSLCSHHFLSVPPYHHRRTCSSFSNYQTFHAFREYSVPYISYDLFLSSALRVEIRSNLKSTVDISSTFGDESSTSNPCLFFDDLLVLYFVIITRMIIM